MGGFISLFFGIAAAIAAETPTPPLPCECDGYERNQVLILLEQLQNAGAVSAAVKPALPSPCVEALRVTAANSSRKARLIVTSESDAALYQSFQPGTRPSCRRFDLFVVLGRGRDPETHFQKYSALVDACEAKPAACDALYAYTLGPLGADLDRASYLAARSHVCNPTPAQRKAGTVHVQVSRPEPPEPEAENPGDRTRLEFQGHGRLDSGAYLKGLNATLVAKLEKYWDRSPVSHELKTTVGGNVASHPDPSKESEGLATRMGMLFWSDVEYTAWLTDRLGLTGSAGAAHIGPAQKQVVTGGVGPQLDVLGKKHQQKTGASIVVSARTQITGENNAGREAPAPHLQAIVRQAPTSQGSESLPASTAFLEWERGWRASLSQELRLRAHLEYGPEKRRSSIEASTFARFSLLGLSAKSDLGNLSYGWEAEWRQAVTRSVSLGLNGSLTREMSPVMESDDKSIFFGTSLIFTPFK